MNVYDFVVKAQKAIPILVNGMKRKISPKNFRELPVAGGRPLAATSLQKPFLPQRKRKKRAVCKLWINTTP